VTQVFSSSRSVVLSTVLILATLSWNTFIGTDQREQVLCRYFSIFPYEVKYPLPHPDFAYPTCPMNVNSRKISHIRLYFCTPRSYQEFKLILGQKSELINNIKLLLLLFISHIVVNLNSIYYMCYFAFMFHFAFLYGVVTHTSIRSV
jgi:hypothetical protein